MSETTATPFRQALDASGITADELARRVSASRRSVFGWLSGGTSPSNVEHRLQIARVLDVPTHELWPESGSDKSLEVEVVKTWSAGLDVPEQVWANLFRECRAHFSLTVGTGNYVARNWRHLAKPMAAAMRIGEHRTVRILHADPDGDVIAWREENERRHTQTLGPKPWIAQRIRECFDWWAEIFDETSAEFRVIDDPSIYACGVFRWDDALLVPRYIDGEMGNSVPISLIRRREPGGDFDKLNTHADRLWERAKEYTP